MYVCRERREGGRKEGGGRESTLSVMLDVRGCNMSLSVEAAAVTTDQAGARRFLCAVSSSSSEDVSGMTSSSLSISIAFAIASRKKSGRFVG
jgi:hypothetical protein